MMLRRFSAFSFCSGCSGVRRADRWHLRSFLRHLWRYGAAAWVLWEPPPLVHIKDTALRRNTKMHNAIEWIIPQNGSKSTVSDANFTTFGVFVCHGGHTNRARGNYYAKQTNQPARGISRAAGGGCGALPDGGAGMACARAAAGCPAPPVCCGTAPATRPCIQPRAPARWPPMRRSTHTCCPKAMCWPCSRASILQTRPSCSSGWRITDFDSCVRTLFMV